MADQRPVSTEEEDEVALSPELFTLLHDQCSTAGIQQVLREAQTPENRDRVLLSAHRKIDLIRENLRKAVASGAVSIQRVHELLRQSEENGRQMVFFYEPTTTDVASLLSDCDRVCTLLFQTDDHTTAGFPKFRVKPVGEVWSDFRPEGDGGWTAKMYRGDTRWVVNEKETESTDTRRVRVWNREYKREVYTFRWRSRGIFEVRVPRPRGRSEVIESVEIAWGAISKLVSPLQFASYSLGAAAGAIVQDVGGSEGEYSVGAARVPDSFGGSAVFTPRSNEQYLHDSTELSAAVKNFKDCSELTVYWMMQSEDEDEPSRVKAVIGQYNFDNGLLIPAKVGAANANHVTDRILEIQHKEIPDGSKA